jgi:hypothetical protein
LPILISIEELVIPCGITILRQVPIPKAGNFWRINPSSYGFLFQELVIPGEITIPPIDSSSRSEEQTVSSSTVRYTVF